PLGSDPEFPGHSGRGRRVGSGDVAGDLPVGASQDPARAPRHGHGLVIPGSSAVIVHLIDGTYELFRHFYGLRRFSKGSDRPFGAVLGVLNTVLQMIEEDATHIGVATDHVIESFRNDLWAGYKTGDGVDP